MTDINGRSLPDSGTRGELFLVAAIGELQAIRKLLTDLSAKPDPPVPAPVVQMPAPKPVQANHNKGGRR